MNNNKKSFLSNFSSVIFLLLLSTSIASILLTYIGLYYKIIDFKLTDIVLRILFACFMCVLITIIVSVIANFGTKKYINDLSVAILEASKGNFDYKITYNIVDIFINSFKCLLF